MTDHSAATVAGTAPAPGPGLEPDAIGATQDTIIGMASSAPAATVGLSLAALVVATAYGSGPILILTAIPMLIIANAYRRLNLWKANTGASFEWVGRAINPYLGVLTGWLMIAAYIIGTVAEVLLLGPSVLAVFGSSSTNTWAYVGIGCAVGLIMLVIAVIGIKITARVQVSMAVVEYMILIGLAIAGLVWVLGHHAGSVPVTRGWFSLSDVNGKGDAVAGVLGGGFWAKAMALSIALSVIATTGTGIVLGARIVYGMASYRVLPEFLGTVSRRYSTPVASSVIVGLLIIALSAVYFLLTSVQNAFNNVIAVTGFLFSIFYILTALAAVVYYRRRIVGSAWDLVAVGVLPLGAAGFLGWVFVKSLAIAPWTQRWSLIGVVIAGLILMFSARFVLRSAFFQIPRESEVRPQHHRRSGRRRPG